MQAGDSKEQHCSVTNCKFLAGLVHVNTIQLDLAEKRRAKKIKNRLSSIPFGLIRTKEIEMNRSLSERISKSLEFQF